MPSVERGIANIAAAAKNQAAPIALKAAHTATQVLVQSLVKVVDKDKAAAYVHLMLKEFPEDFQEVDQPSLIVALCSTLSIAIEGYISTINSKAARNED